VILFALQQLAIIVSLGMTFAWIDGDR